MEKKEKREELQSRREFFKKAAKSALPILGAIALANAPVIADAAEGASMGCKYCSVACSGHCDGTCKGSCRGECYKGCLTGCYAGCKYSCTRVSGR